MTIGFVYKNYKMLIEYNVFSFLFKYNSDKLGWFIN